MAFPMTFDSGRSSIDITRETDWAWVGSTSGYEQTVVTITYRKRPLVSARIETHIVYTHPTFREFYNAFFEKHPFKLPHG